MAMEEAKLMGLELLPDPERNSNAPRDHNNRAKYLYDNNEPEDWGSTASESDSESELTSSLSRREDKNSHGYNDDLETGGLNDAEIDRLDGKTSSRIERSNRSSIGGKNPVASDSIKYPERETGANTGPKGVIADQKYHQQQQLHERLSSQQAYNARMLAKAPTTTTYRQDRERELQEKKAQGLLDDDDLKALEKEEEDEKAILERIRGKRLQEMAWAAKANSGAGKKMFGSLMEMNSTQYVNAIDTEKKDVTVVIHIYNEYNPACKKLDECLIQLAGRYATSKFIRIKAREVDFDEEVCPTVLAYRAGDLIANLVMITYELSEKFDAAELEELFTTNKVLSPHDQCQRESSFFDITESSSYMASMTSQFGDLNMMSLGLGIGDAATAIGGSGGGGGGGRRGILSGNVKEFRYQDYEDSDDEDDDLRKY
ncbi:hypothetical protein BGZ80_005744 [Entomortierella chlamydospora]|uniref:Phosducin domain-containing protein n=1 Tax=Entomortierella chlamydospora TaxID=101097 RepID=A0A9P6SUE1_9FUNG|nr:hypothetical protein BGZ79_008808 [Entomortierella chlamydospora]KAG0003772.1 hypothetical protein BGZ80_005744 [Entomortierella chlamydospora]